jgi:hypothetical protein
MCSQMFAPSCNVLLERYLELLLIMAGPRQRERTVPAVHPSRRPAPAQPRLTVIERGDAHQPHHDSDWWEGRL